MVGLQRGTVNLESHQKEWIEEAQNAIKTIRETLGDVLRGCEHVGSSSVEELEAKPIIDIVVGVDHLDDVRPFVVALGKAGFIRRPSADVGDELFLPPEILKLTLGLIMCMWSFTTVRDGMIILISAMYCAETKKYAVRIRM